MSLFGNLKLQSSRQGAFSSDILLFISSEKKKIFLSNRSDRRFSVSNGLHFNGLKLRQRSSTDVRGRKNRHRFVPDARL